MLFAHKKLNEHRLELSRFPINIVVVVKELNLVRRGRNLNRFWHEAKWLPDRKLPLADFFNLQDTFWCAASTRNLIWFRTRPQAILGEIAAVCLTWMVLRRVLTGN